jgi:lipoprotein-anchoring transpeptidase ErfK/SrfK
MSRSRKQRAPAYPWILLLAALVIGVWWWWPAGRSTAQAPRVKAAPGASVAQLPAPTKPAPASVPTNPPAPVVPTPAPGPPAQTNLAPAPPSTFPRPVGDVFEAQLALARQGISSGSLDGLIGPQTRAALRAFQQKKDLPATGELDPPTKERLLLTAPPYTTYTVTTNDLSRLQPLSGTWLGKSQQTALDYETILELVAEKGHSHPNLIRRLNPSIDWANVVEGTAVRLPEVAYTDADGKAAFATISLSGKVLEAFDAKTNLLAHFPCSIAQRVEKRPVGELHVAVIAPNPNYTFDPDVFPESVEARQLKTKLILPPGPNNPVGVAWIGLDKPGYGVHGTPSPEQVGRTESHGCFRLANWNAEHLVKLVWVEMPVYVEP